MIIGRCKGDLAVGVDRPDLLPGEFHVFKGIRGAVLLHDLFCRNALLDQIAFHGRALGDHLVRSLTAGGDKDQFLPGLRLLLPVKRERPVDPSAQQRRGRAVLPQAAAQDDQEVLIMLRLIVHNDHICNDHADKHAFKVKINSGKGVGDQVVDHDLLLAAGGIKVEPHQNGHTAHQQQRENDAQNVDESPALMPDQRDVGDAQRRGKDQDKRQRQDHKGRSRVRHPVEDLPDPILLRKAQQLHGDHDMRGQH